MKESAPSESGKLRRQAEEIVGTRGEKVEIVAGDRSDLPNDSGVQKEDLRRVEGELEKSREKYKDLFDFAPVAYLGVNSEGVIVLANRAASDLLGLPREELMGQKFSRFIHPGDQAYYSDLVREVCESRTEKRSGEMRLPGDGGASFYIRVDLSAWVDACGGLAGWRIVLLDISGQKSSEEKLKKYAEKLERSNQELQEFAFTASHDLNEPLRKIDAFGDLLQRRFAPALGEEGMEHVGRMRGAAKRLQDLTRGLLEYSRVTAAGAEFVLVDLEQLVCSVLSDLEWQIERNGAKVVLESLPILEADPNQMRRLFQNLISNALKFHGENPVEIKISSRPRGITENSTEYREIIVEDNGIGFEEIHAERIFSLFERLHGRGAYEGTGMGLAICRRIVESHGGSIVARSAPGKGATFTITLPVKQQ